MKINEDLKKHIMEIVLPSYEKNEAGHRISHINYVIERSFKFAKLVDDINYDMVYVIAAYHDIGHYIDAKNHEKVSAEMLLADKELRRFFTEEEIKIMAEAVYDHRASLKGEPRSIYGKIVSSADRNTIIENPLKRTYSYRVAHNKNYNIDEIIEESRLHLLEKFGIDGYANDKMYFKDLDYERFLQDIRALTSDKDLFKKKFCEVNGLDYPNLSLKK